jgi:hypothetical protein
MVLCIGDLHMEKQTRVVLVPGNGAGNVHTSNWYGWLYQKLKQNPAVTAVLENMPGTQQE